MLIKGLVTSHSLANAQRQVSQSPWTPWRFIFFEKIHTGSLRSRLSLRNLFFLHSFWFFSHFLYVCRISKQIALWRSFQRQSSRLGISWAPAQRNNTQRRNSLSSCTKNSVQRSTSMQWSNSLTQSQLKTSAKRKSSAQLNRFFWKTGKSMKQTLQPDPINMFFPLRSLIFCSFVKWMVSWTCLTHRHFELLLIHWKQFR